MNTDEILLFRGIRPEEPLNDPAVEKRARALLRAGFHAESTGGPARADTTAPAKGTRRMARRLSWRVATATAVAAAAVAWITLTPDGDPMRPGPPGPKVETLDPVAVLDRAARTVGNQVVTRPRPHQWIYIKDLVPGPDPTGRGEPKPAESWFRFDGEEMTITDNRGRPLVVDAGFDGDDRSPRQMYDQLDRLPTETGALLAEVYTRSGGHAGIDRDDRAFTYIMTTFRDATIVPPQVQAALYRVLARIPGVRIVQNVEDPAGRRGIAVARESDDLRSELILDATTYRFLGERTVVARDKTITPRPYPTPRRWRGNRPPGPSPEPDVLTAGRVLNSTTRLETGVVDRPGRRP